MFQAEGFFGRKFCCTTILTGAGSVEVRFGVELHLGQTYRSAVSLIGDLVAMSMKASRSGVGGTTGAQAETVPSLSPTPGGPDTPL